MFGAFRLMLLLAATVLVAGRVCAQTVVVLPGYSLAYHISDDGRVVSGFNVPTGSSNFDYFMWSAAQGFRQSGTGTVQTPALGAPRLSGDGHFISAYAGDPTGRSFILSDTGAVSYIPSPDSQLVRTDVAGLSYDGSVASGVSRNLASDLRAGWRWTQADGFQILPMNSLGCMSGDGNTIVGSNGSQQSIIWYNGTFSTLLNIPGSPFPSTTANAANFDGSIIVGSSGGAAARWINGQGMLLPPISGVRPLRASDTSEDGQVIVGHTSAGTQDRIFIWTPSRGSELIADYFASYGINVAGNTILEASVNASGNTFALAMVPDGTTTGQTLIITVPAPGTCLTLLGLALQRRRRSNTCY